ncbi:MAG: hypothetical protein EHM41_15465 [Chloroflexi bacterium]|nr:MAG: hypothetical protein EHM41_15465 [Chloroflexota bacterium]
MILKGQARPVLWVGMALCILLLVTACQPEQPVSSQTALPTSTFAPSETIPPSETPTGPPTVTPTRVRPTPTPTPDVFEFATSILTEFYITTERSFSPGPASCNWSRLMAHPRSEAANLKFNGQFFTYVTLNCFRPGEIDEDWVLMEEWQEGGLGYPMPNLLGWSADGKFMYFYDLIIPDGCSPPGGFQRDLRQVDLMTGEIRPIPIELTGGLSLSPDTSRVSYYRWEEREVGVYTFASGEEQRFPFDIPDNMSDWYAGDFTWSPEGESVLFVIQYGDTCFPTGSSIHRVDISTGEVITLVEEDGRLVDIVEWSQPERALITINGEEWWLDTETGEVGSPQ